MRRIHASTHTSHTERHSAGAQCRTQPHLPFLSITTVSFLSFLSRITHRFYRVTEIPTQTAHPRLERPTRRSLALPLSRSLSPPLPSSAHSVSLSVLSKVSHPHACTHDAHRHTHARIGMQA